MKQTTVPAGHEELPFDIPITAVVYRASDTNERRFRRFHAANPHVYRAIVRKARLAKLRGMNQWSMAGIFEILRWSSMLTIGEPWKLGNNHRAFYARLVMKNEKDLRGFFQTAGKREAQW